MKKLIALLLAVLMFASLMSVGAYAEDKKLTFTVDEVKGQIGDEVTLKVRVSNNPGFAAFQMLIVYDHDVLEKVSFAGADLPDITVEKSAVWVDSKNTYFEGDLLILKFKIKDGVSLGKTVVTLEPLVANIDEVEVPSTVVDGGVNIVCSHISDKGTVTKEPNCTQPGEKAFKCTKCGAVIKTEIVPAKGHTWGDWKLIKEATVTEKGLERRTCTVCGTTEDRDVIADTVTVKFDPVGGQSNITSLKILKGGKLAELPIATRGGFEFKGWFTDRAGGIAVTTDTVFNTDTTVYAQWTPSVTPEMSVEVVKAAPGEDVELAVNVSNNPGVAGLVIDVEYNHERLKFNGVANADTNGWTVVRDRLVWAEAENYSDNGTLLKLKFTVLDTEEDGFVGVAIKVSEACDYLTNDLFFKTNAGGVNIVVRVPGDANGDGIVNIKDVVLLKRYIGNDETAIIIEKNMDVNADGQISVKDAVIIKRVIGGDTSVELK